MMTLTPKKDSQPLSRQERMAKALRENLFKRKQQQRERADSDEDNRPKKTIDENT